MRIPTMKPVPILLDTDKYYVISRSGEEVVVVLFWTIEEEVRQSLTEETTFEEEDYTDEVSSEMGEQESII